MKESERLLTTVTLNTNCTMRNASVLLRNLACVAIKKKKININNNYSSNNNNNNNFNYAMEQSRAPGYYPLNPC